MSHQDLIPLKTILSVLIPIVRKGLLHEYFMCQNLSGGDLRVIQMAPILIQVSLPEAPSLL